VSSITVLIISSKIDPASENMKKGILKKSTWEEIGKFNGNNVYKNSIIKDIIIITLNDNKITHENIENEVKENLKIEPKVAIFLSRHRSITGKPTLTTHPIGNYNEAKFGGKEKILSMSSPKLMTHLLRIMKKNADQNKMYHQLCFEVTHHGPYMTIPTFYVEVGSTEDEWVKQKPADILAESILQLLEKYHYEEDFKGNIPVLVGVGGGHYAPRFTDVALEKNCAFGHMIPNYHIKKGIIEEEMIKKTIKATPNFSGIYIHRKSMKKSEVTSLKNWFKSKDINVFSSKELPTL
jgi:D-aminoacyl-tRNA deacylase